MHPRPARDQVLQLPAQGGDGLGGGGGAFHREFQHLLPEVPPSRADGI